MRIAAALLFGFALLGAVHVSAEDDGEIWVWTTPDGAVHYTDDRERVPEAYRDVARAAHKEGSGWYQSFPAAPSAQPAAAPAAGAAGSAPPSEPTALDAAAEAGWREEAKAIDARIAAAAPQVEACMGDHVNLSPGDGSRKRREELDEAARCAQAEQDLASARADREALEERAHRAGVPPGWVRASE